MLENNITGENIAICTDSQAALKALDSDDTKSKVVLQCCNKIREFAKLYYVIMGTRA